jgi:hypothetical protein
MNYYDLWPQGETHGYLHLALHPDGAGEWSAHWWHESSSGYYPKGIVEVSAVPLPSALLLFGSGLAALVVMRRRFRK